MGPAPDLCVSSPVSLSVCSLPLIWFMRSFTLEWLLVDNFETGTNESAEVQQNGNGAVWCNLRKKLTR